MAYVATIPTPWLSGDVTTKIKPDKEKRGTRVGQVH
jgi:hypothetical protein